MLVIQRPRKTQTKTNKPLFIYNTIVMLIVTALHLLYKQIGPVNFFFYTEGFERALHTVVIID